MKRLISALLIVGLIVTSLPAFAVSAFAGTDGTETVDAECLRFTL